MNQYFIWAASWLHVHFRCRYSATAFQLVSLLHQHSFMVSTAAERSKVATCNNQTWNPSVTSQPPELSHQWCQLKWPALLSHRKEAARTFGWVLGVRSDPGLFQTTRSWHAEGSCGLFQLSVERFKSCLLVLRQHINRPGSKYYSFH